MAKLDPLSEHRICAGAKARTRNVVIILRALALTAHCENRNIYIKIWNSLSNSGRNQK